MSFIFVNESYIVGKVLTRAIFRFVTPQSGNSQRDWSKSCHVL